MTLHTSVVVFDAGDVVELADASVAVVGLLGLLPDVVSDLQTFDGMQMLGAGIRQKKESFRKKSSFSVPNKHFVSCRGKCAEHTSCAKTAWHLFPMPGSARVRLCPKTRPKKTTKKQRPFFSIFLVRKTFLECLFRLKI